MIKRNSYKVFFIISGSEVYLWKEFGEQVCQFQIEYNINF